jgi:flagellar biosynthetic protein FlhB
MSDDRTQPPSKRRRQLARKQGQVAHSPELTAAGGWLAAVLVLGAAGQGLARGLVDLVRDLLAGPTVLPSGPAGVAARVRGLVLRVGWPLGVILAAFAAGALAAHQLQVRGLWETRLIAPDPARLWAPGRGPGNTARAGRVAWATVKALVVISASAWMLRLGWDDLLRLCGLEGPALARAAGRLVLQQAGILAGVLLVLGGVDYGLRYFRYETMLRTTAQEQREDQRAMDGDLASRAQRRRVARARRGDAPELLAGASLVLHGPDDLTVVLAGGPPPRRVAVRAAVRGAAAVHLRRSAEAMKVPQVVAGDLTRHLAHPAAPGSPLPAVRLAELAAIWPDG